MPTEYLRPSEAAKRLNVSSETVRKLCRDGRLPCLKIGAQYRIPIAEAERMLQNPVAPPSGPSAPDAIPAAE